VVPNIPNLNPNSSWASLPLFDRKGWKRVRFGDVVENCAVTCDPAEAGLERFVAMEHLEPGSLHVRSWGNVADGTTFTRRCRPGQVLFGKRRAYQRKVAVAEFEAVVSGDIYVLAPKDTQRLLPELLPFLCLSERFFQHAVGTSAGSLSPRTNWSSLASFEFDLPPLDKQRRIAEILWAVDEAVRKATGLLETADAAELVDLKSSFAPMRTESDSLGWTKCTIADLGELKIGQQKSPKFTKGLYPTPYLKVGNISDGRVRVTNLEEMDFDPAALAKYRLKDGDLLLTEGDLVSAANVGRSAMFRGEIDECGYQNHLIRLRCHTNVRPDFGLQLLRFLFHSGVFARAAKKTTVVSLGVGRVAAVQVAIPDRDTQLKIAKRGEQFERLRLDAAGHVERIRELGTNLMNAVL
jgi:type I restriction enzyme S subunit